MHLEVVHLDDQVRFHLVPGDEEPRRTGLVRCSATWSVDVSPQQIHPDLLVLAAVLCARPWISRRTPLTCTVPASPALAEALRAGPGLRVTSVSPDVSCRRAPDDGVPGLCFSGGTDSVAALALMPARTRCYHLLRRSPFDDARRTAFDTRAAEQACEALEGSGRGVTVVETDVEYLRDPIGFPHDFTTAVPLLLHADVHRLDAVAWGAPLEATYRLQRGIYRDFADSPFVREWGPAFAAVGLPVCVPIAGVSEVVTSTIVHGHELGRVAQSCVRGPRLGRPCGRCAKCARKTLLSSVVTGRWPAQALLERQWRGAEPRTHLLADPIKVEPVIAHAAHRYLDAGGPSQLLRLVADKTGPDPLPWLTRSYGPALEHLPERYRPEIARRLSGFADPMSAEEEAAVRAYGVPGPEDPGRRRAQVALETWMDQHPPLDRGSRLLGRMRRRARSLTRRLGRLRREPLRDSAVAGAPAAPADDRRRWEPTRPGKPGSS